MRTYLVIALTLSAGLAAQAQTQVDTSRTIISATGVVRQTVAPDRATLNILVEPQAMSVDEASRALANAERAVMDTLRKLNIPASAIQVFNNGVAPYRNQMNPMQQGPSFAGREIIRVDVTRVDMIAGISSAALARGATIVAPPSYYASIADSVRRALLPQAFQQAQKDAEALAHATGFRLGRLLDTSAGQSQVFSSSDQQTVYVGNMYDSGQRAMPTSTVTVTVTARFLLIR